jgi:hypothetical protein
MGVMALPGVFLGEHQETATQGKSDLFRFPVYFHINPESTLYSTAST